MSQVQESMTDDSDTDTDTIIFSDDDTESSFTESVKNSVEDTEDDTGSNARDIEHFQNCSIDNTTEKAITTFGNFVLPGWPEESAEGNVMALKLLRCQFLYGGGFCTEMDSIDLSTPANVRLDIQAVLGLLKEKMNHCTINSVGKFVLPNVKELTTGDNVKNMLGDFCGTLCGNGERSIKIKEVVIKCDEISNDFTAGDLEWVEDFLSCYSLDRVTIYPARKNKEYNKFYKKLCGKKKSDYLDKSYYLKKRPPLDNTSNASKKSCTETPVGEADNITTNELIEKSDQESYSTVLWDQWKTDQLHEKCIDGRGVTIAILDSGISIAHEAFEERITAVNDITCSGTIDLTTDPSGHGTLCASVACGAPFKSTGSKGQSVRVPAGVAPAANIIMYKVTGKAGQADAAMITKGLQQCLKDKKRYNIDIVLLSCGSDHYDYDLCEAVDQLKSQGVLVVTASGNNGLLKDISYPARFGNTVCAGAHDVNGEVTSCTSKGRALDFTAPGKNLTGASSVHPSTFLTVGGTSLAAACVAGLLALIIQRARDIAQVNSYAKQLSGVKPSVEKLVHHQDTVKKVLRAISRNPSEHKEYCGYGCLKPAAMLLSDRKLLELLYEDVLTTVVQE